MMFLRELASRLFKRNLVRECKTCIRAMIVEDPCHLDFSRESCSENAKHVSEQWSSRTPGIATFPENPVARMKTAKIQKTDILTFVENPSTRTTTTKGTFCGAIVFRARSAAGLPWSCCRAAVELCSSSLSVGHSHGGEDMDRCQSCVGTFGTKDDH